MPRGIYDRSKMAKKKIAKSAKEVDEVVKLKSAKIRGRRKPEFRTLPKETMNEFIQKSDELVMMRDSHNITRGIQTDRINTIITLLEMLRGSL